MDHCSRCCVFSNRLRCSSFLVFRQCCQGSLQRCCGGQFGVAAGFRICDWSFDYGIHLRFVGVSIVSSVLLRSCSSDYDCVAFVFCLFSGSDAVSCVVHDRICVRNVVCNLDNVRRKNGMLFSFIVSFLSGSCRRCLARNTAEQTLVSFQLHLQLQESCKKSERGKKSISLTFLSFFRFILVFAATLRSMDNSSTRILQTTFLVQMQSVSEIRSSFRALLVRLRWALQFGYFYELLQREKLSMQNLKKSSRC
jgi:hypothetical protein